MADLDRLEAFENSKFARPKLPRPVTLLFGLPLNPDDFLVRLDAQPCCDSDFLRKYDNRDLPPELRAADRMRWWTARYDLNVAQPLRNLAAAAASLGCEIRERATLSDLRAAATGDAIAVIVSHWKGPEFSNDDFLRDFDGQLKDRLSTLDHPLARAILQSIQPRHGCVPFIRRRALSPRDALRRYLDAQIEDELPAGDLHYELDTTRQARRRTLLDEMLRGLIRPGNRLELFDGLHAADEISHAIPREFSGVLDLTVCTSTYLGDRVGHAAAQRFRTVQFLKPQDFLEASIRLNLVLTLFASSEGSYLKARADVFQAYTTVLGDMRGFAAQGGGVSNGQTS